MVGLSLGERKEGGREWGRDGETGEGVVPDGEGGGRVGEEELEKDG